MSEIHPAVREQESAELTYLRLMELECADCGCLVDSGVVVIPCEQPNCCCIHLPSVEPMETMAARLRVALNARDMNAFRALIADNAKWGDGGPDDERTCHNRNEIVATYKRLLDQGVRGTVTETVTGPLGIVCRTDLEWPEGAPNRRGPTIYQAFFVADGLITRIVGHDDPDRAIASISN